VEGTPHPTWHCQCLSQHREGSFSFCRQSRSGQTAAETCCYQGHNLFGLFNKEGRNKTWEMRNCLEREGSRKGSDQSRHSGRSVPAVRPPGSGVGGSVVGVVLGTVGRVTAMTDSVVTARRVPRAAGWVARRRGAWRHRSLSCVRRGISTVLV